MARESWHQVDQSGQSSLVRSESPEEHPCEKPIKSNAWLPRRSLPLRLLHVTRPLLPAPDTRFAGCDRLHVVQGLGSRRTGPTATLCCGPLLVWWPHTRGQHARANVLCEPPHVFLRYARTTSERPERLGKEKMEGPAKHPKLCFALLCFGRPGWTPPEKISERAERLRVQKRMRRII